MSAARSGARRRYCTYFDSHYLARGIVMLRSLLRHDGAEVSVLALDDTCARVLAATFGARIAVVTTATLHAYDPALALRRGERSTWAFYATHKPVLALHTLEAAPRPRSVTFIDADTWFLGDPLAMFDEIGTASIALSPHRFDAASRNLAIYGTYNAGCITWADDATARACLAEWRAQCLEWCAEEALPDGRFMNQGYLDAWPRRYPGVHVIAHPGVNLGPWNVEGHALAREGDGVTVDGAPLVFYHFSGVERDAQGQWFSLYPYPARQRALAHAALYAPYLAAVEAESAWLQARHGIAGLGSVRQLAIGPAAVPLSPTGPPTG